MEGNWLNKVKALTLDQIKQIFYFSDGKEMNKSAILHPLVYCNVYEPLRWYNS